VPPAFRFCNACGFRMDEASSPTRMPMSPAQVRPMQRQQASITRIRPDGTHGGTLDLRPGVNLVGRSFGPMFENDSYLSPAHARIDVRGPTAVIHDLDSLNGVFIKITREEELHSGQILRIGQELLRFELLATPEPSADGTEPLGSPNPGYWGKLTVIFGRGLT